MALEGNTRQGRVSTWLQTILPVMREGGPITLLVVLILAGINLYFMNGQLHRQQELTQKLVADLLTEKNARVSDAINCMRGVK